MNFDIVLLIGFSTLTAFLINLYLTPILIYFSHKHELFDKVNDRKIHTEDTSRLGGIGIYASFVLSLFISPPLLSAVLHSDFNLDHSSLNPILLIISTMIIFLTGILDDFAEMRARKKLVGQIIAAAVAIAAGASITVISLPFTDVSIHLGYFSIPVTMLWILGITNSINLIDGLDGLSSGISLIAAIFYGFFFIFSGHLLSSLISFILAGSLLSYLFYNFPPARIFMGDCGSLFLGFILAILPIATFPESGTSLILPITMLAIPILDVVSAIWRRTRDKKNVFHPDRFHIHHKLLDLGLNSRNILSIVYGLCFALGISVIPYVFHAAFSLFYVVTAWIILSLFFITLHYKKKYRS